MIEPNLYCPTVPAPSNGTVGQNAQKWDGQRNSEWDAKLKAAAFRVLSRDATRDSRWDVLSHSSGKNEMPVGQSVPLSHPDNEEASWRAWVGALAAKWHGRGHPSAHAAGLAYGEALTLIHGRRKAQPHAAICAGCGAPLFGGGVHLLPDGGAVCADPERFQRCLTAYGIRWRSAAAAALAELGIPDPGQEAARG